MGHQPLTIALILALATAGFAQTAFDPAGLAIGARSLGMGGTGAALAEGAETIFNNPAGLGEIDQLNFSSQAGNVLDDVTFTQLAGLSLSASRERSGSALPAPTSAGSNSATRPALSRGRPITVTLSSSVLTARSSSSSSPSA